MKALMTLCTLIILLAGCQSPTETMEENTVTTPGKL